MMNNDILVNIEDENISVDISDKVIEVTSVVPNPDEETNKYLTKIKINNETFNVGDENTVVDENYVHTDNNYTDADKLKVSNIPTKTSDLTNDSDFVDSNYVNDKIEALKWELGEYDLSVDPDNTVAYQKTIPSGTIDCMINKIGGMSYKINQLVQNGNFNGTSGWVSGSQVESSTASNNVLTITTYASTDSTYVGQNKNFINGHKYLILFDIKNNDSNTSPYGFFRVGTFGSTYYANYDIGTTFTKCYKLFEFVETSGNYALYAGARTSTAVALNYSMKNVMCFDLTAMGIDTTDVSVAISELLKRGIDINEYQAYDSGSIRDSAVSSVVSKDSNDTTLDTYTIDSHIQALNGYGWGINDTCYNYIDNETNKFNQKVNEYTYNSTMVSLAREYTNIVYYRVAKPTDYKGYNLTLTSYISSKFDVATDTFGWDNASNIGKIFAGADLTNFWIGFALGTTLAQAQAQIDGLLIKYELATPVETDITQYITTNKIKVEQNGTLTFTNTNNQAVPSEIDYLIEGVKA